MKRVAAIVPTYKRAAKLVDFIRNFNEASTEADLYFVIVPDDVETLKLLKELKQNYFVDDSEYCGAINCGFKFTKEPFVLCASDDVVFNPGWDRKLLKMADENPTKHIFGGIDSWEISLTQKHISHPFIRRAHYKYPLYNPEYIHYMEDIEFEQRGFLEGCVMVTPQILIEHPHTITDTKADWDETYNRSFAKIKHDESLYHRRKGEFEVWDFVQLNQGRIIPTKLNPIYNQTLVSIVIPSYNDYPFMRTLLQSVIDNTFYRFEIIIIDDHSDEYYPTKLPWEKINYKEFLDSIVLQDQSCEIRVVHNDKQKWINHNWNLGAEMARGNYVAFLNSDITLSKDWDKFLVSALETPGRPFTIASPWETNIHNSVPFTLDGETLKYAPNMLKGPCFMLRKSDVPNLFPIPSQIKHWCGDNYLSDQADKLHQVVFAKKAIINHQISQSSKKVKPSVLLNRTFKDIVEYEKVSGKEMKWLKARFPEVVKRYCWVGEDE